MAVALSAAAFGAQAQTTAAAPAGAPAGSTVLCKDGTFGSPATKSGACREHHGIQTWYGPATSTQGDAKSVASATPAAPAAAASPAPVATPAPAAAVKATGSHPPLASIPVASGGGAGKVWVNETSKVYHCAGDPYYGKTHNGAYMTEAEARTAGAHAAHNKACS